MATNEKLKNQLTNRKESAPVTPEQTVEAYMKKMAQNGGSITEAYGYEPYESHCFNNNPYESKASRMCGSFLWEL